MKYLTNKEQKMFMARHLLDPPAGMIVRQLLETINELRDFVEEIATNWGCDKDSHRYNTLCRRCEAMKLLGKISAPVV